MHRVLAIINTAEEAQIKVNGRWIPQYHQIVQIYLLIDLFKCLQNKQNL